MQIVKANTELVKAINKPLPGAYRQSCVLLRFKKPINTICVSEFYRIHLTLQQLNGGEDKFYMAEVNQTNRTMARNCPACGTIMAKITTTQQTCREKGCKNFQRINQCGPIRGVVRVQTFKEWIVTDPHHGNQATPAVLLVLDRRYNDNVLAGVYRAAGVICDQWAWELAK